MKIRANYLCILATLSLLAVIGSHAMPAQAEEIKYRPEITEALQISFSPEDLHIVANPVESPFATKDLGVVVSTNNITGYYMTMSAESTDLLKSDDESGGIIPTLDPLEGGYTEDTFTVNHWGYKSTPSGNYFPFVSDTRIASGDTKTNGDTTTLTFATKVDFMKPSGTYETTLNFAAIANPLPIYLQDFNIHICPEDEPMEVVDIRDGEKYLVQKLADGNCWMLDNLRLDPTQVTLGALKGYTNASDTALEYLKNGGGESPYAATAVVSDIDGTGRTNPGINANYKNTTSYKSWGAGSGKIGVYYNYCAASAGSYCDDDPTDDAYSDICPKGWRMPTGGTGEDSELNNLYLAYDSDEAFKTAFSATISGNYRLGGPVLQDYYGRVWTSTIGTSSNMVDYYLTSSDTNLGNATDRYWGQSVRCIFGARSSIKATYLQDITPEMIDKSQIGAIAVVKDKRDEEEYVVSKLADGNLWMLDNLRLDPTEVSLETLKGNTNASDETLEYLKNGGGSSPYPASGVSSTWVSGEYSLPYVDTTVKNDVAPLKLGETSGKVGVYYNYCAASAGSYCYGSSGSGNATEDICPAGWKIPSLDYTDSSDYRRLRTFYESDMDYLTALGIAFVGEMYSSPPTLSSTSGYIYLWASTYSSSSSMRAFYASYSSDYNYFSTSSDGRYYGIPIRCIYNRT